jgi:hypothetical protein
LPKYPSIQMYPGDWKKDPALRSCSIAARGLWWEMLQSMFECPERGVLKTGTKPWEIPDIATDAGIHISSCAVLLEELEMKGVLSRRESDGAIFSRRMVRDEEARKANAERQAEWRERNKHPGESSNAGVTPGVTPMLHRSSSSSSTTNHKIKTRAETTRGSPNLFDQKRKIEARDLRVQKEAETLSEARVGSRPEGGNMPARPEYMEFIELRDHGRIPYGVSWSKWKSLTPAERDDLLVKPGPQAVWPDADLKKVGST